MPRKPAAPKPPLMIPFDASGNVPRRAYSYQGNPPHGYTMKENFKFEDTLRYNSYQITRGSCYVEFISRTTKARYPMSMLNFDALLLKQKMNMGYIRGTWTFVKRANCYGIKIISASKLEVME